MLERDHYDLVFHLLAVRNTAKHPRPSSRPRPTAARLGDLPSAPPGGWARGAPPRRSCRAPGSGSRTPRRLIDLVLRFGPHGLAPPRLSVGARAAPHGVDLGPSSRACPGG